MVKMAVSVVVVVAAAFLLNIIPGDVATTTLMLSSRGSYSQPPNGTWSGKLQLDTALVNIIYESDRLFDVFGVSKNCYKCQPQLLRHRVVRKTFVILDTSHAFTLVVRWTAGGKIICNKTFPFVEYGKYNLTIRKFMKPYCGVIALDKKISRNTYQPILIAFGVLAAIALSWILFTEFCRRKHLGARWGLFKDSESLINADLGSPNHMDRRSSSTADVEQKEVKSVKAKRLKSLDTFRGISLTVMIFVNFGGGGYYFFAHSIWNGLTVADLVFPWFMWIMGVSMVLSFRVLRRKQISTYRIIIKITKRTLLLFALGLFTSNMGDLTNYRIPGVLQRFAACYFVVAVIQVLAGPSVEDSQPRGSWWDGIRDVVSLWAQWLLMFAFLIIYVVVTYATELHGCPRGYTGPGGISDNSSAFNCTGGMASHVDSWLLGKHVYQRGTFKDMYRTTVAHDPEGVMGTLTSIFIVFLGVQAGHTLFTFSHHRQRLVRWFVWAVLLGVIAIGLSGGTQNDGVIPINKNLWSISFVLATGSMAFLLLSFCYVTIEVWELWNGAPFIYPGMNSILVYCGHEWLGKHFPFSWDLDPYYTHADKLFMNIVGTSCWVAIAYYLHWIEFFLKI